MNLGRGLHVSFQNSNYFLFIFNGCNKGQQGVAGLIEVAVDVSTSKCSSAT
jgi:hypothetical protein